MRIEIVLLVVMIASLVTMTGAFFGTDQKLRAASMFDTRIFKMSKNKSKNKRQRICLNILKVMSFMGVFNTYTFGRPRNKKDRIYLNIFRTGFVSFFLSLVTLVYIFKDA